jgi:outer membrane immunogenic protein
MRNQLLASAAVLTISASSAFAAAPAPVFTWSGCYVGVHAGIDWGTSHWAAYNGVDIETNGAIGGAQAGCNYQIQNFVLGVEGEVWGSGLTGSTSFSDGEGTETLKSSSDAAGDVAARFGYAFDHALLFGKVGVAWAHYKFSDTHTPDFEGTIATATGAADYSGLLLGVGVEYAFDAHWSVKGEFDYINYGSKNVPLYYYGGLAYITSIRNTENIVKVGGNYRF